MCSILPALAIQRDCDLAAAASCGLPERAERPWEARTELIDLNTSASRSAPWAVVAKREVSRRINALMLSF
jgi:hypothetical protein